MAVRNHAQFKRSPRFSASWLGRLGGLHSNGLCRVLEACSFVGGLACVACSTPPPAPVLPSFELPAPVSQTPGTRASAALDRVGEAGLLWRFQAGGSVPARAAVSSVGNVYVASTEGYVHALRADGSYRWSYRLPGSVLGAPAVGVQETIFVGTTSQRIYALRPDGTLRWIFRSPSAVMTDVLLDDAGLLYGGLETLYRVSQSGQLTDWAPVRGGIAQGPVLAEGSSALVATRAGDVLRIQGSKGTVVRAGPASLAQAPLAAPGGGLLLVDAERLVLASREGRERFSLPGVAVAGVAGDHIVAVTPAGVLLWLESDGQVRRQLDLRGAGIALEAPEERVIAAPALAPDGRLYLPTNLGRVLVVGTEGVERGVRVARAALSPPVVDVKRWRIVICAHDGTVASLGLSPAQTPGKSPL